MCVLFFAIKQHPKYPVIICANRDEFHQRPTQAMHWWSENNKQDAILAGKDLQAGGSWLGLTKQGRFSALTNFRQPQDFDEHKKSRGCLVVNALAKPDVQLTTELKESSNHYNGFTLVYGQLNHLMCFDSVSQKQCVLNEGFHSMSNGALHDIWPKMSLGLAQLSNTISSAKMQPLTIEKLFILMKNHQQAQVEHLPQTGIPTDWEHLLSSIFIISPEYGTRTTNIITLDNQGNINVYDRSYNAQGEYVSTQEFQLT